MRIKPIKTEKTLKDAQLGRYTFAVSTKITKPEIKAWVNSMFEVNSISVQTSTVHGKKYRSGRRGTYRSRPNWKKAVVTLKTGQKIDIYAS